MKIVGIAARQILDSRGTPTIEADVWCEGGVMGRAAVPSGASTGKYEAHELRDGGVAYGGKGVEKAVLNVVGEIKNAIVGRMADDQHGLDALLRDLDGTDNKSRLGANALLAVSLATAQAAARVRGLPLYRHINDVAHNPAMSIPMPMMNVLNGGRHATHSADFQEYMLVPVGAKSYKESLRIGSEVYNALHNLISERGYGSAVGDEGGFTLPVQSNIEMLDYLNQAVVAAGYEAGKNVAYALDVAASEFFSGEKYSLKTEDRDLCADELIGYLLQIVSQYPVVSVEDGLDQDDWSGWANLTRRLGHIQLVGDDLLVTNSSRLEKAIRQQVSNAILIKPNQIGTLTETIETIKLAQNNGYRVVVSHRSGETEDTTIVHLAVGTGAGQIKIGSLARGERTAKHNELLRIEESNPELVFSGLIS